MNDSRLLAVVLTLLAASCFAQEHPLRPKDHVVIIGNTFADRMQHHAWLETYIHALLPDYDLTFRNLGFSGDELKLRQRSASFGTPDEWLAKCRADVICCFFGFNESFRGPAGLTGFADELGELIDHMRAQKYNGKSAPRLIVFSPIAHENLNSPHLPSGEENNKNLALYTAEMRRVCKLQGVPFVDLFSVSQELYKNAQAPLTLNGVHLLDHGNKMIAQAIVAQFAPDEAVPSDREIQKLREAVLEKNHYWFNRYRVVDGYNVYGGRSTLNWHGQSNADVMKREMEIFDVMTGNRDKRVWAVARGGDLEIKDDNLPAELVVKTNKPGPLDDEKHPYLGGEEAIEQMAVHPDMQVNLFASEQEFPRLINPVQVAVDTDSRLWVSVWPSYPHWNPTEQPQDALLILPDENRDGKADKAIVFADELNSVTGFEFWNGGVVVAAPPELWYLRDSDGDDVADVKIRLLQGISSADTHHSANAMVVGPDGWLYWSRGIFNVAAFETPRGTFRSGQSGVYRFNPRTFEVEFHYPIGPNPHGDVFDQWGFQFANDGTSGTGGYVSLGKGLRPGGKQWFKKDWRPVAATGLLSSSQFPSDLQGNFLICNTIGFLGVLQYKVQINGAEITAVRVEDVVRSQDPNFRPSDIEVGGDGSIYVSDWHNVLIGHMQHNMRDPNRDHQHGRIYRISAKNGKPLQPAKMRGKPIADVCQHFFAKENAVRYRARLELTSRSQEDIRRQVGAFARKLDVNEVQPRDEAQALLECLWVFEEQRIPNMGLLDRVFEASEPRVRAAAIRTLGHWAGRVEGWETLLVTAARDESALVRAEAVKAAVEFKGVASAEVVFEVATRGTDNELNDVLAYGKSKIDVDAVVADTLQNGRRLSAAAYAYVLQNAKVADLERLEPAEEVFRAILSRQNATTEQLGKALGGLAHTTGTKPISLLLRLIESAVGGTGNLSGLGELLVRLDGKQLQGVAESIETLALEGPSADSRQIGYAAWLAAADVGDVFLAATKSTERLSDFLLAVRLVPHEKRAALYSKVEPLISSLPSHLQAPGDAGVAQAGIQVDYYYPRGRDVQKETLAKMKPTASGIAPGISLRVPQRKARENFALRFRGTLQVPARGRYTFRLSSDDGSRLYIDGRQVINHDGNHGMGEKRGSIDLRPGPHQLLLTYANNTGNEGLKLEWEGPGIERQALTDGGLTTSGGQTLHDLAIDALSAIPGHETQKFTSLAALIAQGKNRPAAIAALSQVDPAAWPAKELRPLADNLVGYLSELPSRLRTGAAANQAVALAKSLAGKLSPAVGATIRDRLENLDVRVIALGTVPTRMIYDKEQIVVQAGKAVEFRITNNDHMPHNFVIGQPGALQEIGELAEATAREPDAAQRQYVPKSSRILLASQMLQSDQTQSLVFEVPKEPGVYPYVCTYPGHWRRMFGALYVVENLEQYQLNPEAYLAANPLAIKDDLLKNSTRGREWQYDDLIANMKPLPGGRSFDVGKALFKAASCTGCHKLNDEGQVFGPDLAKLDSKKSTVEHILRSILEPSKDIDEKYQSVTLVLDTGKTVTGMVVEENDRDLKIVVDPLAKGAATTIAKEGIEDRSKASLSLMPQGLLDRLTREEILDLVAYVLAGGDKEHKLFMQHHHDH